MSMLRPAIAAAALTARLVAAEPTAPTAQAAQAAAPPASRLELRLSDDRVVRGVVIVEAEDGGLLVEYDDGRYELLQPDRIRRRDVALEPEPASPDELGRRIVAELPAGFDLLVTKHYIVCFATSRDYARWCAAVFERLHDAFVNYWSRAGLEVAEPARPLVVVIFADRRAYEAHAAATLGAAAGRVAGYYDMLSNRVTTYDLTGSDAAAGNRRPGTIGLAIRSSPEAAGLVATLVHEATHQLAFNAGLHRRLAPVPLWVSEGIATYFETPDLQNSRGWKGIGEVNGPRLERFLRAHQPGLLERLVCDDELLRQPDTALDAYAAAWAVTHYLLQSRRGDFVGYLRQLAGERPLAEDSPAERLRAFRDAFGDPAAVEARALAAAARLGSRR
jgi:hypothetical protein